MHHPAAAVPKLCGVGPGRRARARASAASPYADHVPCSACRHERAPPHHHRSRPLTCAHVHEQPGRNAPATATRRRKLRRGRGRIRQCRRRCHRPGRRLVIITSQASSGRASVHRARPRARCGSKPDVGKPRLELLAQVLRVLREAVHLAVVQPHQQRLLAAGQQDGAHGGREPLRLGREGRSKRCRRCERAAGRPAKQRGGIGGPTHPHARGPTGGEGVGEILVA